VLENNQDKINWFLLAMNPGIFELNYVEMRNRMMPFAEELAKVVFAPWRVEKYLEEYNYNIVCEEYE